MATNWLANTSPDYVTVGLPCGVTLPAGGDAFEFVSDPVPKCNTMSACCRQRGPILRTEEGQATAVLCNDDDDAGLVSVVDPDVCVVECPDTPRSEGYDTCDGVHDISVTSHPLQVKDPEGEDSEDFEDGHGEEDGFRVADGDFSDVGDASNTEVVYVREGVCVRPTENEKISGRLSLILQDKVMFLSWLPYSHGELNEDGTFRLPPDADRSATQFARDRGRYAVHPLPMSEVKAIKKHTPSFGWHYIVLVLTDGLTLPPLYFSTGGVKALFNALKENAYLLKSADDPNTFLINDTADPLQRSLTSLELADVLLGGPPHGASATFAPTSGVAASTWDAADSCTRSTLRQVLEQFSSKVTQVARDTASSFFGASGFGDMDMHASELVTTNKSLDMPPIHSVSWSKGVSPTKSDLRVDGDGSLEERRRSGGEASTNVGVFELIDRQGTDIVSESRNRVRPPPLSLDEWGTFLDAEGRIADEKGFRQRVFDSGVEPALRRTAWKFLLGFFPMNSTAAEREALMAAKREEYAKLKMQWMSISDVQAARFAKWRERKTRVDKDVRRTDRLHSFYSGDRNPHLKMLRRILLTYTMYNFDLGYCQGMSDLASPLLYVIRDEAEAFWCFAALMEKMESNFHTDCTGMHAQLLALRKLVQLLDPPLHATLEQRDCLNYFFCYRWLLIHFKREFSFDEVMRLWEALWSRHLSEHFHLYCCVAVLVHHRRAIIESDLDFDGLLKYCIDLSGRINLDVMLRDAEILCRYDMEVNKEGAAGLL